MWPAAVGAVRLHLDRAGVGLAASTRRGSRRRRVVYTRAHLGRRWRSTASRPGPRRGEALLGLLQPALADLDRSRSAARVVGVRAAARRPAAARAPARASSRSWSVMIGTVTFDGLSQGARLALTSRPSAARHRSARTLRRHARPARWRRRSSAASTGSGWPARTTGRRRLRRDARWRAAFVHSLVPIAARLRRRALPHVPRLRGPGDPLHGLGPVRPGLGPVRLGRSTGIDYGVLSPERHLVPAGRAGGRRARRRAGAGARPRARPLRSGPVGGPLPILDAGDHGRVHDRWRCGCSRRRVIMRARARRCSPLALARRLRRRASRRRPPARPRSRPRPRLVDFSKKPPLINAFGIDPATATSC